jgi:glycosyltransferase involved in cell wall biosynthesis
MKICIISKYPPIEGGISAKTYWMAKGFAERGVEVHVITNANCVEKEYCVNDSAPELPPNVTLHYTDSNIPWHIPFSELYETRLLDKALEVVLKNKIDVIDTNYLIPYGIVGYLLSNMTGIPHVLRHGGSDLAKFLNTGIFKHLLEKVIQNAAAIITDEQNERLFKNRNSSTVILPRYIPDERVFHPSTMPHYVPTFACIGKINYYWKYKSLDKIAELFAGIREKHRLLLIGQGKGYADFAHHVEIRGLNRSEFIKFVHPEHMPALLAQIDYLLFFTQDNPIKDFSNIVCEALWSGIPVITDKTMDITEYTQFINLNPKRQIIRLDLENVESARNQISTLIKNFNSSTRCPIGIKYSYDRYIEENLIIYRNT